MFVGQYLFTGSETSSVYLDVVETRPESGSVMCRVRNSASLSGLMLTVHLENVETKIPVVSQYDIDAIRGWGARNAIDFVSLSCEFAARGFHPSPPIYPAASGGAGPKHCCSAEATQRARGADNLR